MRGLGQDHPPRPQVPAKNHLRRRGANPLRCGHDRLGSEVPAMAERRIRLDHDAALATAGLQLRAPEARMALHLVDGGKHPDLVGQPRDVLGKEVRDANRPDRALVEQPGHHTPRVNVGSQRRGRPVDEVQVDHVNAQGGARRLKGAQRGVVPLLEGPQLGRHKDLARKPRCRERRSDPRLVHVRGRGVHVAIAQGQRLLHGGLRLVGAHLKRPKPNLRNLNATCQHDSHAHSSPPSQNTLASSDLLRRGYCT